MIKLNEILDKIYPYQWNMKHDTYWIGEFKAKHNRQYSIMISYDKKNADLIDAEIDLTDFKIYRIIFKMGQNATGKIDILNTGDQFAIFATIIKMIKDFVLDEKPDGLTFNAKENSRIKLYDRLVHALSGKFGFIGYRDYDVYLLLSNKVSKQYHDKIQKFKM